MIRENIRDNNSVSFKVNNDEIILAYNSWGFERIFLNKQKVSTKCGFFLPWKHQHEIKIGDKKYIVRIKPTIAKDKVTLLENNKVIAEKTFKPDFLFIMEMFISGFVLAIILILTAQFLNFPTHFWFK